MPLRITKAISMTGYTDTISSTTPEEKTYKPKDMVEISGIYRVMHDKKHTPEHEVTAVKGRPFPQCNRCGNHPRFLLKVPAQHLEEHPFFKKLGA